MVVFYWLMVGHFVADYPLQTDFLAKFKSPLQSCPVPWYYVMASHCAVHAGAVTLATGSVWLGLAEFVIHFSADVLKCYGLTNIHTDQAIHFACKIAWAFIAWAAEVGAA